MVGHKGSGKTSLVEAMLYLAKVAPRLGKPGDRAAGLDEAPEEKAHLATLESRVVALGWRDARVSLVDTPGEASFGMSARLALLAADTALLCVSARDGVQSGTERALRWIREAHLPCVVVVTKMDDPHARPDEVIADVRRHFKTPLGIMELADGAGPRFRGVMAVRTGEAWLGAPETPAHHESIPSPPESTPLLLDARAHLVDDVAATDDTLTEHYLTDGDLSPDELDQGVRRAVAACKLVPLYEVSSTLPSGVAALLDAIADVVPPPSARPPWQGTEGRGGGRGDAARAGADDAPFSAVVIKTSIDPHAGRFSWVRVVSGTIAADAEVMVASSGQMDHVAQVQRGTAKDLRPIPLARAGEIVALTKLKTARTGDTLCDPRRPFEIAVPENSPAFFSRALVLETRGAEDRIAQALARLADEDPALAYTNDEESRAMVLSGVGVLHLDVTLDRLKRRVPVAVKLGPPRIPYRETIRGRASRVEGKQKKQTGGHGQYGLCYIDVEPAERGAGLVFEDAVVGGAVPRQFIGSVEKGVRRAMARGVLGGFPTIDVKVRLLDGKAHSVDSSDAAFQTAGFRAMRAALLAAKPCVLEPVVKLDVTVPGESVGDVIGDLNSRHARVLGTADDAGRMVISALVPLAATLDYEPKLTALTHGRGHFALGFDHYDHASPAAQEKAIAESGWRLPQQDDE